MNSRLVLICCARARPLWRHVLIAMPVIVSISIADHCQAQLCGQLSGVNFSENFNTLAPSGTITLSASFEFAFNESQGNLTYTADNGSNLAADTYSYGATGSFDRA